MQKTSHLRAILSTLALVWGMEVRAESALLLVKNAKFFTMAAGEPEPFDGYMVVGQDGRIQAIGAGVPDDLVAATTVDMAGQWVLPGFISAHSHWWQSAWRGLASDQTLMGGVDALYLNNARKALAEDFYWFTLEGGVDHLRHGITSAYNFNYGGWSTPEYAKAQLRGELASGMRFVHGQNFGGWGEIPSVEQGVAEAKAFLAWIVAEAPGDQFLAAMINGTAAFRDSAEAANTEAAMMREVGISNHVHFLESAPDQYEERSRFRWMLDAGMITSQALFGHFIHTDPWILDEVQRVGASMSWNPLSNGRLASGTPDIPDYLKRGIRVGMGVDGQASADRADPWENLRMGLYAVRAMYEDAGVLSPYDVIRLHTWGSADAMGVADKVGSLEVGKFADFIVMDPTDFGVVFDPYATLAFMGAQEHLRAVYVGGVLKVDGIRVLAVDYPAVKKEVYERVLAVQANRAN
jgi:5-methylthioadenosine/S-adenosylhomocysteine deaminase